MIFKEKKFKKERKKFRKKERKQVWRNRKES